MINDQDFERLEAKIDALMSLQRNHIDLDAIWTVEDVADYLRMSVRQTRERVMKEPTFPRAYKFATGDHKSRPRYKAREIIDWVEIYWEQQN